MCSVCRQRKDEELITARSVENSSCPRYSLGAEAAFRHWIVVDTYSTIGDEREQEKGESQGARAGVEDVHEPYKRALMSVKGNEPEGEKPVVCRDCQEHGYADQCWPYFAEAIRKRGSKVYAIVCSNDNEENRSYTDEVV